MQIKENTRLFPKFLIILFLVEFWERFAYYGMRAILTLFLISHFQLSDKSSYAIYSIYAALSYAGPIVGGWIADKWLGFSRMVLVGGIIISIGHLFMTLIPIYDNFLYLGLALIAVGAGFFKGNITNLLGSCYDKEHSLNRSNGFTLFYVGVNLGGVTSGIICSYIGNQFGNHYAFGLAGLGMVLGLITFIKYHHVLPITKDVKYQTISKASVNNLVYVLAVVFTIFSVYLLKYYAVIQQIQYLSNIIKILSLVLVIAIITWMLYKIKNAQERKNLIALIIFTFFFMIFFMFEMQLGSIFCTFIHRNVDKFIFGKYFLSANAASSAINPLSIVIFGTLLTLIAKRNSKSNMLRFAFGILSVSILFIILYYGCVYANDEGYVNYIPVLLGLLIMSIGEVFISPFLQGQATLLSPQGFKGLIMGMIMLSLSFANLLGLTWTPIFDIAKVTSSDNIFNPVESLEVYKQGFLQMFQFNTVIFILFLLLIPVLKYLLKNNQTN
ncbi:peptide MFS transporter [Rickettsia endosymbiont of Cardiosporidium cionae]|uniref:peptide MFS transporter n=1 Tax=Rickettsia endosymbiont of Cardiosporidium cionae TaxID=2777155 RepID=UPI0018947195|nr:peptide MFS transporter [Rickettsia endosymbiont of Cardiosporidium cionae]KAF8818864.1 Dipeptide permease D [Rickettsia endosymbiont of Cardiosporidium cionae]